MGKSSAASRMFIERMIKQEGHDHLRLYTSSVGPS